MKAFAAFYFNAKHVISNMEVLPLIEFLTRYGIQDFKYFTHRSERCRQEIFLAIGLKSTKKHSSESRCKWLLSSSSHDVTLLL